jgi:hypothetical protein
MKNKHHRAYYIFSILILLWVMIASPSAQAQFYPFPPPYLSSYFCPFAYCSYPFLPPPSSSINSTNGYGRIAHVPLTSTSSSLFPAPILPAVPIVTTGGVGVSTLIPTAPVTVSLPLNSLIATPLAPLITYTPLSLVGLTYAPVPTTASAPLSPIVIPTAAPTVIAPAVTIGPSTSAAYISLILNALSGLII